MPSSYKYVWKEVARCIRTFQITCCCAQKKAESAATPALAELCSYRRFGMSLRSSHRLRADRLFGLDASAPVGHRLDQLADLLARALVMQVHLLVEESGGPWHQHLRVGYHDGTNATEHST